MTGSSITLDKARQVLAVQADFGGSYNRNSARLILSEVRREHGQAVVDSLIRDLDLGEVFRFEPGKPIETRRRRK
jgi:hypothetical protein